MDTEDTARAIRRLLLKLDPKRRSKAYCKAAREYMQWAARIEPEERTEQEALRQIYEQQRRGRGPRINRKNRPHRGWEWQTSSCRLKDGHHVAVEGWLPPGWAAWPRHKPSSRLSLEVFLAVFAVFHDLALPQPPPLMDYHEERPNALGGFLWHLRTIFKYGTSIGDLTEPGIDAWGLPIAQSYLDHAKALLRAEKAGKAGLPLAGSEAPPTLTAGAAAPPQGNWSRPMPYTEMAVRLFKNATKWRLAKSQHGDRLRRIKSRKLHQIRLDGLPQEILDVFAKR